MSVRVNIPDSHCGCMCMAVGRTGTVVVIDMSVNSSDNPCGCAGVLQDFEMDFAEADAVLDELLEEICNEPLPAVVRVIIVGDACLIDSSTQNPGAQQRTTSE